MKKHSTYLKIYQAVLLMILAIIITLVLAKYGMDFYKEIYTNNILYFLACINSISFGIVIFIGYKIIRIPLNELFPLKKIQLPLIISIFLTSIGLAIIVSEIDNIFQKFFPMQEELLNFFMELFKSNNFFGLILVLLIVAPLTEELFFRGIIFKSFINNYNFKLSILVSSLLFGLIHLNLWQFLGAFIAGIYLSWIYYKTENILTPIIAHSVFNSMPLMITRFSPIEIEGLTKKTKAFSMQPMWLDAIGLVLIIIGLLLANTIFKQNS